MVIKIAERLDCYSILQLTKVSRIFRATLLPIIHQFCSYSVAHYDKMNVVVVPGGDAYGAYTNNDMHFLWKKVELPSHVIVKKAKPGLSCSYLMCFNLESSAFELWWFPNFLNNQFANFRAIKVEIDQAVDFIELFIYDDAVFALNDNGDVYAWSAGRSAKDYEILNKPYGSTLNKPELILPANTLWCDQLKLGLGKAIFTNHEAFELYVNKRMDIAALILILRQNSAQKELICQQQIERLTFADYFRDNHDFTLIYPMGMPNPVIIKKLYFQSQSLYAVSENNHCFAWGDNTYNCLGIDNAENIVNMPHPVVGLDGEILTIVKGGSEQVEELDNLCKLAIFVTSCGIYYSGRQIPLINTDAAQQLFVDAAGIDNKYLSTKWRYYKLNIMKHPQMLCEIPQGGLVSRIACYKDLNKIRVVVILDGGQKQFLFCSQIALHEVDMRWYRLPRSYFYAVLPPENDAIKEWLLDDALWLVTEKGCVYKWDMGWGNQLSKQLIEEPMEKIFTTGNMLIALGRNTHKLPKFFSMPLKRSKGDHPNIKLELKEQRFPMFYAIKYTRQSYSYQMLVSAAREFLICWSVTFKFKNKEGFAKLLHSVTMLANGHLYTSREIDFIRLFTILKQNKKRFSAVFRVFNMLYLSHIAASVEEGSIAAEGVPYPFQLTAEECSLLEYKP